MSDPTYYGLTPLSTLFHGDVTIETGYDPSLHGPGDLKVYRQAHIGIGPDNSTESINATTGSLVVHGGAGITGNSNLRGRLTVNSTSNLQTTYIDTSLGPLSVSGGNAVSVVVGAGITFTTTSDSVNISSANRIILEAGLNGSDAIQLSSKNSLGGIRLLSGQNEGIDLITGSGGIDGTSSAGNISFVANDGNGSFIVNSSTGNQKLSLLVNGSQNSGILMQSGGDNTSVPAIHINTTNNNGVIYITNNSNGNASSGQINLYSGTNGVNVTTNTGGSINLLTRNAPSSFIINSTLGNSSHDLTIGVYGNNDSSLVLESQGTSDDALQINTTNSTGSIKILQATGSGGVNITTGSNGFGLVTQNGGQINLLANGAPSSFINNTNADNQNLTVCVQGDTSSKLILCSTGKNPDAITIQSTGQTGGIFAVANGPVSIQSTSVINIGTNPITSTPVNIGTPTSLTTVLGNLDVRGVTTTYESTVVQIADNILELNTIPFVDSNSGIAVRRFQSANNNGEGNVIQDTPEFTGIAQSATTTTITLALSSSSSNDAYAGYWIKITSNTGQNAVRRIKSYNGSTKVATIYSSSDQIGVLGNPSPREGLDWGENDDNSISSSVPTSGSGYALYPCEWIVSMWDETNNEWALVCSNHVSGGENATPINPLHYINLHINNLTANGLTVNTINNLTADVQFTVTLTDNSTAGVELNPLTAYPPQTLSYPNYGVFIALVRPKTAVSTRCFAVFIIGRRSDNSTGQIARLISVKGTSAEMLDMEWASGEYPRLRYRPAPGGVSTTDYLVKMITI